MSKHVHIRNDTQSIQSTGGLTPNSEKIASLPKKNFRNCIDIN